MFVKKGGITMPDFGSPFSGMASERKLSEEELIRAIRFMIAAEYEAVQLYMQLAESTDHELAIEVFDDRGGAAPIGDEVMIDGYVAD